MICADCNRPKLLDLFCCAGGAAVGYWQAGFCVTGVDIKDQPNYPFEFVQGDAIEYLKEHGHEFAAVHASPPCQAFSRLKALHPDSEHPDLVDATRLALEASGLPFIIENVEGAPLVDPITLCGSEFGLGAVCDDGETRQLRRHRLFESNLPITRKGVCNHQGSPVGVYGHGGGGARYRNGKYYGYIADKAEAEQALGIDWMLMREMSQALPPAYTHFLGRFLMGAVVS